MSTAASASGIDLAELDPAIRPQDDLFRHVNGKWIARTEIPADKARYGSFAVLAENAEEAVRDIITGTPSPAAGAPATTEADKVAALYASFMDTDRVDALGAQPIAAELERALAVSSIAELVALQARLERQGTGGFFGMFVDNDPGDPARYIVFVMQGGLGLPDESYYREEQFEKVREQYRAHIARMLGLAGVADAERLAGLTYELERRIAASHWDKVASRDIQKLYNLRTLAELGEITPQLDWTAYLAEMGAPEAAFAEVVAAQPDALAGLAELLVEDELDAWRAWTVWGIVRSSASLLSQEISRANFDFYGTALTGAPEQRDRWRRGVSFVEGAMGEAVGRIYVERHFDEDAKAAMDGLVDHLIEAYRDSIERLEWMGADTRTRALEKLDRFTPKIGYPVKWRDYSGLTVDSGDLVGNSRAVSEAEFVRELGKVGKPIDRDEWFMTPQTVNAYYNPGFNEIVFPAAILQPPFFDKRVDGAANFGAIGAVIGHEIGHGFDDQGSRYDGDGKLTDWWTESDRAAFEERTSALIGQYNALSPEGADGQTVNGELTIGENIGDLSGLEIAWKAYLRSLAGAEPPVIDGLSGAERFFLSWAQAWQQKSRPEETVRLLTIDPHSPNEFRCNQILRNLAPFHEAYATQPGDALWLDPAERVSIW
ncbi:M13 family metallopeptidase [Leucobacter luti]|uniref:Putative endopeptidase n=1 Tax=Leucobacter luti TaxID=340320 RepID=A0A4Q7U3I9_9MICO|nr:M13-type metalloendopeptidase [Leucobacter luti]MBL3699608.1 peptidase M13 [Leucobacter luti]RZT67120.1 putative endopeptidase [Leucobacter luti]